MLATEFMSTPPITLTPETSVKAAARLLYEHRLAAAPVVTAGGCLVGMVSEIDLLRRSLVADPVAHLLPVPPREQVPAPRTVQDVMSAEVHVLRPNADLYEAADLLATTGVRSAPVVDGEHVLGVVSRADLLRALARSDEAVEAELLARLRLEFGPALPVEVAIADGIVGLTPTGSDRDARTAQLVAQRLPGVVRVHVLARR